MRTAVLTVLALAGASRAQPVAHPDETPMLAQIRDDKALADALTSIAQDPAIRADDPQARPLAQALMAEGVRQLQTQAYDQALANFLEAYNKLPSPKILLNIASTLRDMGRLADAANTYARYLADPATGPERVAEVKDLLNKLDEQLAIVTIRVFPRGSEVSLDGGPFVAVGASLLTRVRPGIHLVRVKKGDAAAEITVNAFEGENKDVAAALKVDVEDKGLGPRTSDLGPKPPEDRGPKPEAQKIQGLPVDTAIPDKIDGWLITGTQYGAANASSRERRVRTGYAGPELQPIMPHDNASESAVASRFEQEDHISSGLLAVIRVDGKGRGFAGGLGLAYAPEDHVELEVAGLRSQFWGAYLGARYRFLTGKLRPYAGGGIPIFFFTADGGTDKIAVGGRLAAGIELEINGHFSVAGDLGYEHFLVGGDVTYMMRRFETDLFVPTVGVVGRL